jgi:hypothetical protein
LNSRRSRKKISIILSTSICKGLRTSQTSSRNFIQNKMTTASKIPVVRTTKRAWRDKSISKSEIISLKIAASSRAMGTASISLNVETQSSMIYPMSTNTCLTDQMRICHRLLRIRSPAKMSTATPGTQPHSRCLLYLHYLI